MKKKTKIIISSTAILSIASIVIGCSLACVQYKSQTSSDAKASTISKPSTVSANVLASTATSSANLNDNAYTQTINQNGTINPLSKPWTKSTALNYYTKLLDSNIKIFGITNILKWDLIQNFNYQVNQLVNDFANNTQFTLTINKFNYAVNRNNSSNDTNLSNYKCNITFSVNATLTSKTDRSATLSFENEYTYHDVSISAIIHNIGDNGYGYFSLSNTANGTLVPNEATYFKNVSASSSWTNDDFAYLIQTGYLPTTGNTGISTSNYQSVLAADCARALNSFINNSSSLTDKQQVIITPVNDLQLYTFNVGPKFADLNSLVIEPTVAANSVNGNMYTYSYSTVVSLTVNLAQSTIDPSTQPGLKYSWQYSVITTPNWINDKSDTAVTPTLTFNADQTTMYRLIVTMPSGKQLISNSIIVNVTGNNLKIISNNTESKNNTYTYSYGTNCTLSINTQEWLNPSLNLTYTWQMFDNSTGQWTQVASGSSDVTYQFNALQADTYRLIITQKNNPAFNLISNSVLVDVIDNNLQITTSATNPMQINYGDDTTFSIVNKIWQNNPSVHYQWYVIQNGKTSEINGANSDTYTTAITASASYYLVITDPSIKQFTLTSNYVQVGTKTTTSSLAIGIEDQSANSSNVYSLTYWSKVDLIINTSYWNEANNNNLVYTWKKFDNSTNKFVTITTGSKNYSFNLVTSGIYQLTITNLTNPNFDLVSNNIHINVVDNYITIGEVSSNQTSVASTSTITPLYGDNVTLGVTAPSIWADDTSLSYQWYSMPYQYSVPQAITGATSPTYQFAANAKLIYYLQVTNSEGFKLTSNSITVSPQTPTLGINVNGQTSNVKVTYGTPITLQIDANTFWANANKDFTYQWQYLSSQTNGYENVPSNSYNSGTTASYKFNCFTSTSYQLLILFHGKLVTSNPISINVTDSNLQIGIVGQSVSPANTYSEIYGNTVTLDITNEAWKNPSSVFDLTYQWQKYDAKNGTWSKVGTNSNTYTTMPLLATGIYRLVITDSTIPDFDLAPSASLTINVTNDTVSINPTYIQGESNVTIANNNIYSITYGSYTTLGINANDFWYNPPTTASAKDGLAYQWMKYDALKKQFVDISGATKSTYSFYANENNQYELEITNPNIENFQVISVPVIVNIINQNVSVDLTLPNSSSSTSTNDTYNVTYGSSPTLSLSGYWASQTTFTYLTYQWYQFNPFSSSWTAITNATGKSLSLSMIEASGTYKLQITANKNANANNEEYVAFSLSSNDIVINVTNSSLQIGIQNSALSTNNTYNEIYGTSITLDIATQYYKDSTDLTYQWQVFNVSSNSWADITTNGTSNTYSLTALQSNQYRLVITSKTLGFVLKSQPINLNVSDDYVNIVATTGTNSAPTTVQNSYNVPYALKTSLSIINTSYWYTNTTDLKYQWYSINANGQSTAVGSNSNTYSFNPTMNGAYQLEITNTKNASFFIYSNIININVIDNNIAIGINNQEVNTYSTNFGKQVTLSLLSDYWKTNKDATFQWYYLDNGAWTKVVAPTTGATTSNDGTGDAYTFTANSSVSYELQVTYTLDGKTYPVLTSNSINVMVSDTTLMITSDKNSNVTNNIKSGVVDVNYGGSITFSIDTPYWQTMTTGVTYQWEISTDNGNSYTPIANDASSATYTTTIFKNVAYRLMLTINNETLISNQIFVDVVNNTVTISTTSGSNDVNYASSVTLTPNSYWVSNESNYVFTWYSTSDPSKPVYVGNGTATYTFNGFSNQIYYVEVTSKSNETGFGTLTSNNLSIIIQNTTSKISIKDVTVSTSNSYNIVYGKNITLQLNPSDYWGQMVSKDPSSYTFQWEKWNGSNFVAVDSSVTGTTTPSATNGLASTYSFTALTSGQYELVLYDASIGGFGNVTSMPITINVVDSTVQIAYTQATSSTIASSYNVDCGKEVTLAIPSTSYWATNTTGYTYTWQIWDPSTSQFVSAPASVAKTSDTSYSTYVLLTSNMYRLEISEPSNTGFVPIYSNNITFNPLNSTLTITPTTVTTPATGNSYNVVYGTTSYSLGINTAYWQTFSGLSYQWYQWNSQTSKFEKITTSGTSKTFDPSTLVSGTYQLEITDSTIGLTLKSNELTINIVDSSYLIAPTSNAVANVNTYSISLGDSITLGINSTSFWNNKTGNTYQWEYLYNGTWYTIKQMESKISNWNPSYSSTNDGTQTTYIFNVNNQTAGTYKLVLSSTGTYTFSNLDSSNNIYVSVINTQLPITANNESISSTGTYSFNYGTSITLSIEKGTYYDGLSGWDYQWLYFNGDSFVAISGATSATYTFNGLVSNSYELQITNQTNHSTLTSSPLNVDILNSSVEIEASAPYGSSTGKATAWSNNSAFVPYTSPLQLKLDENSYWYKELSNPDLTYTVYNDATKAQVWTSSDGSILTIKSILTSGTYKLVITDPSITEDLPGGGTQAFSVTSNIIAVVITETSVDIQGSCAQDAANSTQTASSGIIDITYFGTANINIKLGSYWATLVNNDNYSYQLWNMTTNSQITSSNLTGPTLINNVETFQLAQITAKMAVQLRIYEVGTTNYIASNILQLQLVNNNIHINLQGMDGMPGASYNSATSTWDIPIYLQGSGSGMAAVNPDGSSLESTLSWIYSSFNGQYSVLESVYQYTNGQATAFNSGIMGNSNWNGSIPNLSWGNYFGYTTPLTLGTTDITQRYQIVLTLVNNSGNPVTNFSISTPITIMDAKAVPFNWQLTTNNNIKQISSTTYSSNPNAHLTFTTDYTKNFLATWIGNNSGAGGGIIGLQEDLSGTWTTIISDQGAWFADQNDDNNSGTTTGFYPTYESNEFPHYGTPFDWSIVENSTWRLIWWYAGPLNVSYGTANGNAIFYSQPITILINTPTLPIEVKNNSSGQTINSVDNIYFLDPSRSYNLNANMSASNIDFEGYSALINNGVPYQAYGYVFIATYEWQKAIINPDGTIGTWTNLTKEYVDPWYNPSGTTDAEKFGTLSTNIQSGTTTYTLPTINYDDLTVTKPSIYKLTVLMAGTTMIGNWGEVYLGNPIASPANYTVPSIAFTMTVTSTFVVVPTTTSATKTTTTALDNYLTLNKLY